MSTDANITYGRLLESVHITGYSAERAATGLQWLLEEDRWTQVGDGFEDIDDFLESIDLSQFKIAVDQRKKLSKQLEEKRASRRASAKALGVSSTTIHRDLGRDSAVTNVTEPKEKQDPSPQVVTQKQDKDSQKTDNSNSVTYVTAESGSYLAQDTTPQKPNPLATKGDQVAKDAEKQAIKAYEKAKTYGHDVGDEWYTPKWLFDSLGLQFSIDVCAPRDLTHVTTPADQYYSEDDDGLSQAWRGTIWCNPPYSDTEPWARKMIEHGDGMLLTHIPMNAAWAADVWRSCNGIRLFQAIEFVRPNGEKQRPGMWLQLAAFGEVAKAALADMQTPEDIAENPRRIPSPMWVSYE